MSSIVFEQFDEKQEATKGRALETIHDKSEHKESYSNKLDAFPNL